MRWLLFIIGCCFYGNVVTAQKLSPRELKRGGEAYFKNYRYHKAYDNLSQYYQINPTDNDIWEALGISAYHVNQLPTAQQLLQRVTQSNRLTTPEALLFLAKTYHLQHQFEQAAQIYKQFLTTTKSTHTLRTMVIDEVRRCGYAMRRTNKNANVIVENLGPQINNHWDDFSPVLSPIYADRLYYSSIRAENLGGLRNDAGYQDNDLGFYCADIYSSDIQNENWSEPRPMTALLNSPRHDVILDFSDDGQVMYFFQGFSLYAGEVKIDTFKTLAERTLITSKLNSPFQPELGDTAPFFFGNKIIIFASRRSGGYGGLDLYYTVKRDEIWTAAKNLGPTINSAYDETTPFLSTDGQTLFFSSNHSEHSRGDYDIFKTKCSATTGKWSVPENLGEPINSAGDDRYFRLSKDGYKAFFASRRQTSHGGLDIYSAYFKNYQSEQQISSNQTNFYQSLANSKNTIVDPKNNPKIATYTLNPLLYENENDLLNNANQQQLQQVISLLQQYPSLRLLITAHSDNSEIEKFDLFFSIKRAERIALFLIKNGLTKEQITIHGVGSKYPLTKANLKGKNNALGKRLNRRITLDLLNLAKEPIVVRTQYPEINPTIATFEHKSYQKLNNGLFYRIQIATSPQMYKGDLITRYPHALVEKSMNATTYQYLVGRYQTYTSARELLKDIQANGVVDVQILPYLNGQKLSTDLAQLHINEYPDLIQFVEAQAKK